MKNLSMNLQAVKILDFTRLLPGPLATQILSDLGCSIVKIESPHRQDYARSLVPGFKDTTFFDRLNSQKELLEIDYESSEGRDRIINMVKNCDALMEQFRPGAMDSWGLGYETLKEINPKLVFVSITGYGQNGPMALKAGHDLNYIALSGLMSHFKDENDRPIIPRVQMADIVGGSYQAAMKTLAAVLDAKMNGKGQFVDVPMAQGVRPLMVLAESLHDMNLPMEEMKGILAGKLLVNYNIYETEDGRGMALGALEVKFWNNFCEAIGKQDWVKTGPMAMMELTLDAFPMQKVIDLFKSKPMAYWQKIGEEHDCCLTPIYNIDEARQYFYS